MQILTKNDLKNIYELDEHLWLQETIKILKENRLNDLDVDNLIEELEDLSKKDRNRVSNFLEQIVRHILLLQYWTIEYERNQNHWRAEIQSFRTQLRKYLTTNLHNHLTDELELIYQDGLEYVREKAGFSVDFPQNCPYTLEQLLDKNWFPGH
ncbi:DUF29 domain-containing protein [Merismopedia glauca]|uniref:DUF29 domain-containing protein n=1 Tax=Merismopedia glauca CCAP 1448/3 TaxID=1296344 RepID=A0A2T1BXV6_9CYAN|nr:DUF29 domain-containing protein [Merismopedia glauca]PSB00753.1 DUF29 domain-containing protein [Merismopedia glauca CCAP 1448/3]